MVHKVGITWFDIYFPCVSGLSIHLLQRLMGTFLSKTSALRWVSQRINSVLNHLIQFMKSKDPWWWLWDCFICKCRQLNCAFPSSANLRWHQGQTSWCVAPTAVGRAHSSESWERYEESTIAEKACYVAVVLTVLHSWVLMDVCFSALASVWGPSHQTWARETLLCSPEAIHDPGLSEGSGDLPRYSGGPEEEGHLW